MAKEGLPTSDMKRELLHSENEVDYQKYGDMYFDTQRYNDAIDFYMKGELKEGLLKVKKVALEDGDYFLLKRISRTLPDEIGDEDWQAVATKAEEKGKNNFAKWAQEEWGKRDAPGGHEGEEP